MRCKDLLNRFGSVTMPRMAKTVIVKLTDDIDGGDAEETVHFSLDGRSYEIDVNPANAARLRDALKPFISKGRPSSAARARASRAAVPVPRRRCFPS